MLRHMGFIRELLKLFSEGTGTARKYPSRSVGDRCPCGNGHIRRTTGRHGDFLGCTNWREDRRGCNNAWNLDGTRLRR